MAAAAFGPHPSTIADLVLTETGEATYTSRQLGSGEEGGDLFAERTKAACHGAVPHDVRARLLRAARAAQAASCTNDAPRRGMTSWSLEVSSAGQTRSCRLRTETASYQAFAELADKVVETICAAR